MIETQVSQLFTQNPVILKTPISTKKAVIPVQELNSFCNTCDK